ncbi:MAG: class I SAM-dependent methyltransferase [Saprospiraceae bacterium]|nr:class I SAM-dependent methyltransferase [Saprospiraceae bacterium]
MLQTGPKTYIKRLNPTFASMVTLSDGIQEPLGPCPACGSEQWKKAGQVKDFSITGEWFDLLECPVCHLKTTYPHPKEAEIGRYYASEDYVSHSDTKAGLINRIYHAARKYMLRKKHQWVQNASGLETGTLIDVGAGTGHFAHHMQENGWRVTALEPDGKARMVAAEKLNIIIKPLEELGRQTTQSFDVITLWHVLEHVHDLSGYMDQFRSILKPGGTLIIAVPNHTSRDAKKYGAIWAAYDVPRHLWHFSPDAMNRLMTKHGFTLTGKIPMPLDAFYVSMLSEKYSGNNFLGSIAGFISGLGTFLAGKKNVDDASSVIYIAK